MEHKEALSQLRNTFQSEDWFCDVGSDNFGRCVVYVHKMDFNILNTIPLSFDGKHVLCHFVSSLRASKEAFVTDGRIRKAAPVIEAPVEVDDIESISVPNIDNLIYDLERLEKICGPAILSDIFYEVHDGARNAVTDLSSRYPQVREKMEALYDEYGFDLIYEELDG